MSISRALMPLLVKSIALCLTPCALRHTANCNDQINEKSICYVYLLMTLLVRIHDAPQSKVNASAIFILLSDIPPKSYLYLLLIVNYTKIKYISQGVLKFLACQNFQDASRIIFSTH